MPVLPVRFKDPRTYERLRERAGQASLSGLAEQLIEEGLRMDAHPGIVFRDGPAGRRAGLAAGADVWEVTAAVQEQKGSSERRVVSAAEVLGLAVAQVRLALRYYGEYVSEIDEMIEANQSAAARELASWENQQQLLSG